MNVFFNKAACDSCHLGSTSPTARTSTSGIGMDKLSPDLGRFT
jgi:cytochrome c peroxidase